MMASASMWSVRRWRISWQEGDPYQAWTVAASGNSMMMRSWNQGSALDAIDE
jgi:hypothetical protein